MAVFSLLFAISMAVAISLVHADQNPPAIFVFGDSLSDVGNNNDMPEAFHANYAPYGVDYPGGVATGRFSNGYNSIDFLANYTGFNQSPPAFASVHSPEDISKGVNFASGGSGILADCMNGTAKKCIPMKEQLGNFKSIAHNYSREFISKSIFMFTCGGNDLTKFFVDNRGNISPPIDNYVANMTSTLSDYMQDLYNLGGRKFLIFNVPALGMLPPAQAIQPKLNKLIVRFILNYYAEKFNEAEYMMMEKLNSTLPEMKYSIGNSYAILMDVVNSSNAFGSVMGMTNVTSPCCGEARFENEHVNVTECSPKAWLCPDRSEYVFWDFMHPTQAMNEHACGLIYNGTRTYASPINLKQLVEDDSSRGGVDGSLGGVEAM